MGSFYTTPMKHLTVFALFFTHFASAQSTTQYKTQWRDVDCKTAVLTILRSEGFLQDLGKLPKDPDSKTINTSADQMNSMPQLRTSRKDSKESILVAAWGGGEEGGISLPYRIEVIKTFPLAASAGQHQTQITYEFDTKTTGPKSSCTLTRTIGTSKLTKTPDITYNDTQCFQAEPTQGPLSAILARFFSQTPDQNANRKQAICNDIKKHLNTGLYGTPDFTFHNLNEKRMFHSGGLNSSDKNSGQHTFIDSAPPVKKGRD